VRVDHPRDDEEARAVDALGVAGGALDDPSAGDGDIGAAELAGADVNETVREDELGYVPATVATMRPPAFAAFAALALPRRASLRGVDAQGQPRRIRPGFAPGSPAAATARELNER
jgi:hypothetical protein